MASVEEPSESQEESVVEVKDERSGEVVESTAVPSAPVFDEEESPRPGLKPQVQYPDLQGMQKLEETAQSGLKQKTREKISMKPFNERQLKELYHNPELVLADDFETEFISNELSCTYKDHPLYDLLKRFSQSRYNLKINMLDLHSFKRSFEDDSMKVWKIEKRELKYSGTCMDGERIFKTEIYESVEFKISIQLRAIITSNFVYLINSFAVLNEPMFQSASTQLSNTLNLVCCNYMSNLYACETLKIQVSLEKWFQIR